MAKKIEYKHSRPAAKKAHKEHSCQIPGCKVTHRAKGYCAPHYKLWRRGEFGKARYNLCNKADCKKPVGKLRGLCDTHFAEWQKAKQADK